MERVRSASQLLHYVVNAASLGIHTELQEPKAKYPGEWDPGDIEDPITGGIIETAELRSTGTMLLRQRMEGERDQRQLHSKRTS